MADDFFPLTSLDDYSLGSALSPEAYRIQISMLQTAPHTFDVWIYRVQCSARDLPHYCYFLELYLYLGLAFPDCTLLFHEIGLYTKGPPAAFTVRPATPYTPTPVSPAIPPAVPSSLAAPAETAPRVIGWSIAAPPLISSPRLSRRMPSQRSPHYGPY